MLGQIREMTFIEPSEAEGNVMPDFTAYCRWWMLTKLRLVLGPAEGSCPISGRTWTGRVTWGRMEEI